jgi:hypothetical protein
LTHDCVSQASALVLPDHGWMWRLVPHMVLHRCRGSKTTDIKIAL